MKVMHLVTTGLIAWTVAGAASADTIILDSGDVLNGALVDETATTHTIHVPYAGNITLQKETIVSVNREAVATDGQDALRATQDAVAEHVEPEPDEPETYGEEYEFENRISGGGIIADGNTSNKYYHLDAESIARNVDNRFTGRAHYRFGESEGQEDQNNRGASLKYDRFLSDALYVYGNVSYLQDDFQNLDGRYAIGTGLGYQIYDEKRRSLSVEGGPTFVHEDYSTGVSEDFAAARWAVDYEQHVLPDRLVFFHLHEGLLSAADVSDLLIRSQTGIYIPVTDRWEARAQFNTDWDNVPAAGREKFDTTYLFGFGYRW